MKILVINSGSSSIKYKLFDMGSQQHLLTAGVLDRIGEESSHIQHTLLNEENPRTISKDLIIRDHHQGLELIASLLMDKNDGVIQKASEIAAVGHRVVHGGEAFSDTMVITEAVKAKVEELSPLAPLHNPPNLEGIKVSEQVFPEAIQVAVFDTAFHQTIPAAAYRYAIPTWLYEKEGIRVYGMHGTSHFYITKTAINYLDQSAKETNLITIHLGNGCSMTAVRGGQSVDTTMGFSPLPGLMMGTRSGDIDPTVSYYLGTRLEMSFDEIDHLLNKKSGLLGICGDNDVRDIQARQAQGDSEAQLALEMYSYRIKKYIGAYLAVLGRVDAIIFTAGVGENSELIRWQACHGLENLGIILDDQKNREQSSGIREIQADHSLVKILVIPTNEELEIAHQTLAIIQNPAD